MAVAERGKGQFGSVKGWIKIDDSCFGPLPDGELIGAASIRQIATKFRLSTLPGTEALARDVPGE